MSGYEKLRPNERRAELLRVLCKRRMDKVDNLAFEFHVSRRTILYDIEELTLTYPIETIRGNGGCVKVADGYYVGQRYLKQKQKDALYTAIENANGELKASLQSILDDFSI